jgi:hypothetical protein
MDSDILQFLRDEMQLQKPEDVAKWQKMICRLIEYAVAEGLPPAETRLSPKEEDRLNRNAEIALLATHSACAWVTKEVMPIEWGADIAAGEWFNRLRGQSFEYIFVNKCLNHLNLAGQMLEVQNFFDAHLEGASLCGADLEFSTIRFARLNGANLRNMKLRYVNLGRSNLIEADLSNASFYDSILNGTDFTNAKMDGAVREYINKWNENQAFDLIEAEL